MCGTHGKKKDYGKMGIRKWINIIRNIKVRRKKKCHLLAQK